jgi:hypothetical protein
MFIAYDPRQSASPQRGDMFIAVASVNNNFSLRASTNSAVCCTPSFHNGTGRNMSPRWGEESFGRSQSYKHVTPLE